MNIYLYSYIYRVNPYPPRGGARPTSTLHTETETSRVKWLTLDLFLRPAACSSSSGFEMLSLYYLFSLHGSSAQCVS